MQLGHVGRNPAVQVHPDRLPRGVFYELFAGGAVLSLVAAALAAAAYLLPNAHHSNPPALAHNLVVSVWGI
mgnify:CR=1 FL=1